MESIIRNVKDIELDERRIYETILGQKLKENQQIIIQVINLGKQPSEQPSGRPTTDTTQQQPATLPNWCNVYDGLTDQQIAELEEVILTRSDLSRPSE